MTHHLLIASEQLWPNLLGLAALKARDGGIQSLTILYTNDQARSEEPSKRIAIVAKQIFPNTAVKRVLTESTSQAVSTAVAAATAALPDSRWTFNCSGGTKTMFAGLLQQLETGQIEAFYLEVSGLWYSLHSEQKKLTCKNWSPGYQARVELPVRDLVNMQMTTLDGAELTAESPNEIDLRPLCQEGLDSNWNWAVIRSQFPQLTSQFGAGFAFESFFAALVQACGGCNIAKNLKLSQGPTLFEFDLIVSTGQKLVLFDLKLTDEDKNPWIVQISRLAEDKRTLGGLGAEAILVRPNWSFKKELAGLAKAHQLKLWTQEDMATIVPNIRRVLGTENCAGPKFQIADEVDMLFQASDKAGKRLFSSPRLPSSPLLKSSIEEFVGWLKLDPYVVECFELKKSAIVVEVNGRFLFVGSKDRTNIRTAETFGMSISTCASLEAYWEGEKNFLAVLLPVSNQRPALVDRLHKLRNTRYDKRIVRQQPPDEKSRVKYQVT